jgi:serine/threonine-protein kinase
VSTDSDTLDSLRSLLEGFASESGLTGDTLRTSISTLLDTLDEGTEVTEPLVGEGERFEELGLLGRGGMGEVRLVRDRLLGRNLARKVLHAELAGSATLTVRFRNEARITAQLQHPGIVPVHDLLQLEDGQPAYTMREVRGDTLADRVRDLPARPSESELRRLVALFARAVETVAYAHARGVVHRDLKPDNIMIGAFSAVLVLDWGIAKHLDDRDVQDVEVFGDGTQVGRVLGTPTYMPPEQALGDVARIGPHSDVYALGATLYEILAGRPPYRGTAKVVVERVIEGPPPRLDSSVPADLRELCETAMARDPADRYADAGVFAEALGDWLDGAQRRERAVAVVEEAADIARTYERLRAVEADARARAAAVLDPLPAWAPSEDKRDAWEAEDAAAEAAREASLTGVRYVQELHGALQIAPNLPEAHAALARWYRDRHAEAEAARDPGAVALEALLRAHDRGEHAGYLSGEAWVSLRTDVPVEVTIARFEEVDRRLVPVAPRSLGRTPLEEVPIGAGSHLLTLRAEGRPEVRYPVFVGRGEHWDGVDPDGEAVVVRIPEELGEDECYVPAGWTTIGGDPDATDPLPALRVWVDGFVIRRHPVTVAEFRAWLEATGQTRELLGEDDHPVAEVSWHEAREFARWVADTSGDAWRLSHSAEWEKAARGVDSRYFPWGDAFEATWANGLSASRGTPTIGPVGMPASDVSLYGVYGTVGNVRDWCIDGYLRRGAAFAGERVQVADAGVKSHCMIKGGTALSAGSHVRLAARFATPPAIRPRQVGFRLVRSVVLNCR